MHHYQWKCTNTNILGATDSLSTGVDVSQFVLQLGGWSTAGVGQSYGGGTGLIESWNGWRNVLRPLTRKF